MTPFHPVLWTSKKGDYLLSQGFLSRDRQVVWVWVGFPETCTGVGPLSGPTLLSPLPRPSLLGRNGGCHRRSWKFDRRSLGSSTFTLRTYYMTNEKDYGLPSSSLFIKSTRRRNTPLSFYGVPVKGTPENLSPTTGNPLGKGISGRHFHTRKVTLQRFFSFLR